MRAGEAIIAANTDAAYKGCPAGSGADTIVLATNATYTLTAAAYSNPNTDGPDGLPPITGVLTVQGNGATITRLPHCARLPHRRVHERG